MGFGGLFLRKVRAAAFDQPTGFAWVEVERLCCSGYPASSAQVKWLERAGVDRVVTLTEKPLPLEVRDGSKMVFLHVPMKDHAAPDLAALFEAVDAVRKGIDAGEVVHVHCLAGVGRTGCVLASYLVDRDGLSAEEALAKIRRVKPGFVERSQEESVYLFAARLSSG
jgi:atypical dual specificity phosphatase